MSNTRAWNLRADRLRADRLHAGQARSSKRQRSNLAGSYHDRVPLDGDMEFVQAREVRRTAARGFVVETPRSPQKGHTAWLVGNTWGPPDDPEFGLDPSSALCDEEFERDGVGADSALPPKAPKKKKSRVSVCSFSSSRIKSCILTVVSRRVLTWSGRRSTVMHTSTRCFGGRGGEIFSPRWHVPTVQPVGVSRLALPSSDVWIVLLQTLYARRAAFVAIVSAPFTLLRCVLPFI